MEISDMSESDFTPLHSKSKRITFDPTPPHISLP